MIIAINLDSKHNYVIIQIFLSTLSWIVSYEIQLIVSFWTVKIDDIAYEEFVNLSVYDRKK